MGKQNYKKPKHKSFPHKKSPKTEKGINPEAFWDKTPTWCFEYVDKAHPRWFITDTVIDPEFLDKLIDFERQTWGEILTATSGKSRGTRNHSIRIDELCRGARKRWGELNRHEDALYSIRIKSKHRWWGLIQAGVFHFIWSDLNHEICPSLKK